MFVSWKLPFRRIRVSTSTSWRCARRASTDYVNSAASGSLWTMNPRQPLCTPSWRHVLITATLFMRCHRRRSPTGCKGWWTQPLELSLTLVNIIVDWRQYYTTSSTGWMSSRRLNSSLVWWCTGVCMTGRLGTSLITLSQPLMLLITVFVYDPLTCRAFYHAGPTVWNSLLDELRNSDSFDDFKRFLKTILSAVTRVTSALGVF